MHWMSFALGFVSAFVVSGLLGLLIAGALLTSDRGDE